jgi:hypothetical protein
MNDRRHYPTSEQLFALEREARRMRAQFIAGLFKAGANALKRAIARGISTPAGVNRRAGPRPDLTIQDLGSGL